MTRYLSIVLVTAAVAVTACDNTNDIASSTGLATEREFRQVERLGNPLVSEVFFAKRDHGLHNTTPPDSDLARGFDQKVKDFAASFNRSTQIQNTLAAVLIPDMLLLYPNRTVAANQSNVGWLTWALVPSNGGWGGRKLNDDVVDAGLTAIFGNLLDPNAPVLTGLTSDNVPASVRTPSSTFPYLEAPR